MVNDLALCLVFFDRRDGRRLERPFIFGITSAATFEAAGIVASWSAIPATVAHGSYRSEQTAHGQRRRFATSDDRPQGLVDIPPINGPTIAVTAHPADVRYKVLYVLGRDAAESASQPRRWVLASLACQVKPVQCQTRRARPAPYDAPAGCPATVL